MLALSAAARPEVGCAASEKEAPLPAASPSAQEAAGADLEVARATCPWATSAAVWPERDLFTLSAPGTVTVEDDGFTRFKPQRGGKHRFLILDELEW